MIFKIIPNSGVLFAAKILVEQLKKLGHDAKLTMAINPDDETIYIIYCAMNCDVLPKNYIVYQTEYANSHWFTKRYQEIIQGALCVWEHSANNIPTYKHLNNRISIVSAGIAPQEKEAKEIPFLFYGYMKGSARRWNILQRTNKKLINAVRHSARQETNLFGEDMWNVLRRTKVVLNIHYYENNSIEQFRINEALSFGCHVVSERSKFGDEKYNELVHFADSNSLADVALSVVNTPFNYDLSRLDNLEEIKSALEFIPDSFRNN